MNKSLSGWEKRQLERALLKALGGLGVEAERLYRAFNGLVKGKLAPWYCSLGRLAVLLDSGRWTVRELRANQEVEVRAGLLWWEYYYARCFDEINERIGKVPRGPVITRHDGGWWASTLGPYEERWQAIGVGWAYDMVPWPWPEEVADSLDWRGFSRQSEGVKA